MQESVIYQDIWEKATRKNEEKIIFRLLGRLFGELDSNIVEQVIFWSIP